MSGYWSKLKATFIGFETPFFSCGFVFFLVAGCVALYRPEFNLVELVSACLPPALAMIFSIILVFLIPDIFGQAGFVKPLNWFAPLLLCVSTWLWTKISETAGLDAVKLPDAERLDRIWANPLLVIGCFLVQTIWLTFLMGRQRRKEAATD